MSGPLVVDTSIAFKWVCQNDEAGLDTAFRLLSDQALGRIQLCAPASLHLELANALRYSELPRENALRALEALDIAHVELVEPTSARLRSAMELSYDRDISIYDALFLALAEEFECPLVTADRKAFETIESRVEIRLI